MNFNVFETFAGIGAQHKALSNIFDNPLLLEEYEIDSSIEKNIVGTSEWFIHAIIGYDSIHHGLQEDFTIENYPNETSDTKFFEDLENETAENLDYLISYFKDHVLSTNSKDPYLNMHKLKYAKLKELYIAMKRNRNYGSVVELNAEDIKDNIDLLTYSFPCTDISNAGKGEGLMGGTRSGLLWEIKRILLQMEEAGTLPRFLLMENVKMIKSPKHKPGWDVFQNFLTSLGYGNTMLDINALEVGIPQSRDRVFCISELHGEDDSFIDIKSHSSNSYGLYDGDLNKFLNLDNPLYEDEYKSMMPNDTASRREILEQSKKLNHMDKCFTITTKADRKPNQGIFLCDQNGNIVKNRTNRIGKFNYTDGTTIIENSNFECESEDEWVNTTPDTIPNGATKNDGVSGRPVTIPRNLTSNGSKSNFRYMTPRECLMLMGFESSDFDKMRNANLSGTEIQTFAGNSIVVQKLELIFLELLKRFSIEYTQEDIESNREKTKTIRDMFSNMKKIEEQQKRIILRAEELEDSRMFDDDFEDCFYLSTC